MRILFVYVGDQKPKWFEFLRFNHTVLSATNKLKDKNCDIVMKSLDYSELLMHISREYANYDCFVVCRGMVYIDFVQIEKYIEG